MYFVGPNDNIYHGSPDITDRLKSSSGEDIPFDNPIYFFYKLDNGIYLYATSSDKLKISQNARDTICNEFTLHSYKCDNNKCYIIADCDGGMKLITITENDYRYDIIDTGALAYFYGVDFDNNDIYAVYYDRISEKSYLVKISDKKVNINSNSSEIRIDALSLLIVKIGYGIISTILHIFGMS
jgi:hypothetical protein